MGYEYQQVHSHKYDTATIEVRGMWILRILYKISKPIPYLRTVLSSSFTPAAMLYL